MLSFQEVLFVLRIQMLRFSRAFSALAVLGLAAAVSSPAGAQVQDWPLLYDTTVVHHLNLSTMAATDTTCSGPEDSNMHFASLDCAGNRPTGAETTATSRRSVRTRSCRPSS